MNPLIIGILVSLVVVFEIRAAAMSKSRKKTIAEIRSYTRAAVIRKAKI